jgi:predicted transcriptional regulator
MMARELIEKYDFKQSEVAERLGTTRATVTQYLSSKRGSKNKQLEILPWIQSTVHDIVEKIVQEPLNEEINTSLLCNLCATIRTNLSIVDLHDLRNSNQVF